MPSMSKKCQKWSSNFLSEVVRLKKNQIGLASRFSLHNFKAVVTTSENSASFHAVEGKKITAYVLLSPSMLVTVDIAFRSIIFLKFKLKFAHKWLPDAHDKRSP